MDAILTLHADHEFNASTFALRVAVATMADVHAATVAAIATLKGPRHGGANEDVLAMLREIGDPARARTFVEARLTARDGLSKGDEADPRHASPWGPATCRVDDARATCRDGLGGRAAGRTRFRGAERRDGHVPDGLP